MMSRGLVFLFLFLPVFASALERRANTDSAADQSDGAADKQRQQADAARGRAAQLENAAKGQDAICAS